MVKFITKDVEERMSAMVTSYKKHATQRCSSMVLQVADLHAARQINVTIATKYHCHGLL